MRTHEINIKIQTDDSGKIPIGTEFRANGSFFGLVTALTDATIAVFRQNGIDPKKYVPLFLSRTEMQHCMTVFDLKGMKEQAGGHSDAE